MPWFKVDDHFHSHPKVKKCGLEVVGLWTVSGSYCMAHLTDGFVEECFVRGWRRGLKLAETLVAAGLWYETTREGEKGWQFHDWDKYQPTKKQVEAEREKARNRKAAQRLSQGESRRDSGVDSQGESRRTSGTVPARPPARPSLSLVTSGGELTQVADPEPPRFCQDHPNGTPDSCIPCMKAREGHDAWKKREEARQLAIREEYRRLSQNCPLCQGTNVIEVGDDEVRKCDHGRESAHA